MKLKHIALFVVANLGVILLDRWLGNNAAWYRSLTRNPKFDSE